MVTAMRGALILIEGLDRSGKSTQCQRLCSRLEQDGHRVKPMSFPNRTTPIGQAIDAYLKGKSQIEDHVIHLLFSANRWEAAAAMREDITHGTTIVLDRYSYSGIVYSVAKDNPGLGLRWAWEPEIGLPEPDLCVFLDIEPTVAAERGDFGKERYENGTMQARVRQLFHGLFDPEHGARAVVINAGMPLEQVEQDVMGQVQKCFEDGRLLQPLGSFESIVEPA